ncbi:MAG: hypothetical protein BWY74_04073 [Firmicutes bacterium ADurb.Bin419]|nr:MAG: hypothetical protein BWY74_04073 [Firmicutes bacterium ADurb.Bin419]
MLEEVYDYIPPALSVNEIAKYVFSGSYLSDYCSDYYYSVCAYNKHWNSIVARDTDALYLNESCPNRSHAIGFVRKDNKIQNVIRDLKLEESIIWRCLDNSTLSKVMQINGVKNAVVVSVKVRKGKLWDNNAAADWIIALPDYKRIISISTSFNAKVFNIKPENEELYIETNDTLDVNLNGREVVYCRVKIPPYISRARMLNEGFIKPKIDPAVNMHWDMNFLYSLPTYADEINCSIKTINHKVTFDHLIMVSNPLCEGKVTLAQYYFCPVKVKEYDHEPGTEISQRYVKAMDILGNEHIFYITNKRGRKIERMISNEEDVYLNILTLQYYGLSAKYILEFRVIDHSQYKEFSLIAQKNYQKSIERNEKYYNMNDIVYGKEELIDSVDIFSKGDRVTHSNKKEWGPGTILGLKFMDENRLVIRVDFKNAGIRDILAEFSYIEKVS